MGGKRKKHNPTYKPKRTPKEKSQQKASAPVEFSEPPLVVFISSLIDKMKAEREATALGISSIPITSVWRFEDTPASSQPVEDFYLSHVRTCDIFVLILGPWYSKAVACEWEVAVESNRPILAFVYDGERDEQQNNLIGRVGKKYASYTKPKGLKRKVAASIWDELISSYRAYIPANAALRVIAQVPLPSRNVEDRLSYLVLGVEDEEYASMWKMFGATDAPPNLEELYPNFEPLPVVNLNDVNAAVLGIRSALLKSQNQPDKHRAFIHQLQREALEIASHYLKRQRTNTPEPDDRVPGVNYYLWGMEPAYARMVKLLRLEETLKEPVTIERIAPEVLFKSAEDFLKASNIIQEASRRAGGDMEELRRILALEATLFKLDNPQD